MLELEVMLKLKKSIFSLQTHRSSRTGFLHQHVGHNSCLLFVVTRHWMLHYKIHVHVDVTSLINYMSALNVKQTRTSAILVSVRNC